MAIHATQLWGSSSGGTRIPHHLSHPSPYCIARMGPCLLRQATPIVAPPENPPIRVVRTPPPQWDHCLLPKLQMLLLGPTILFHPPCGVTLAWSRHGFTWIDSCRLPSHMHHACIPDHPSFSDHDWGAANWVWNSSPQLGKAHGSWARGRKFTGAQNSFEARHIMNSVFPLATTQDYGCKPRLATFPNRWRRVAPLWSTPCCLQLLWSPNTTAAPFLLTTNTSLKLNRAPNSSSAAWEEPSHPALMQRAMVDQRQRFKWETVENSASFHHQTCKKPQERRDEAQTHGGKRCNFSIWPKYVAVMKRLEKATPPNSAKTTTPKASSPMEIEEGNMVICGEGEYHTICISEYYDWTLTLAVPVETKNIWYYSNCRGRSISFWRTWWGGA